MTTAYNSKENDPSMTQQQQSQPPQPAPTKKKRGPLFRVRAGAAIAIAPVLLISACVAVSGGVIEEADTAPASTPAPTVIAARATKTPTHCTPLKKAELRRIARGMEHDGHAPDPKLIKGVWEQLFEGTHDNHGSFDMVVAVELSTGEVATLATNWDISRVIAVNDTAWDYFTWGTATRRGSPMDQVRESILEGDEHQEAIDCVGVVGVRDRIGHSE